MLAGCRAKPAKVAFSPDAFHRPDRPFRTQPDTTLNHPRLVQVGSAAPVNADVEACRARPRAHEMFMARAAKVPCKGKLREVQLVVRPASKASGGQGLLVIGTPRARSTCATPGLALGCSG
jgi:hypothetical protein